MKKAWLLTLGLLTACGIDSGGSSSPLEVIPAVSNGQVLWDLADGDVVSLDTPVQGMGYVIYIGVQARNLQRSQAQLRVRLLGTAEIAQTSTALTFETMGPVATPKMPSVALLACKDMLFESVENEERTLEFQLTEMETGRVATVARKVVPACRYAKAADQLRCHRTCTRR